MSSLFDIDPRSVLHASAKIGLGVKEVLDAVVDKIPPPDRHDRRGEDLRLLLQGRYSMLNCVLQVNFKIMEPTH